jgi:hypothetical protein
MASLVEIQMMRHRVGHQAEALALAQNHLSLAAHHLAVHHLEAARRLADVHPRNSLL